MMAYLLLGMLFARISIEQGGRNALEIRFCSYEVENYCRMGSAATNGELEL